MDTDMRLNHRHYFDGPRGTECRCGQSLDDLNAHVRRLEVENERLRAELDEAQLRSIEARNPGIDMDEVRRLRSERR